MESLGESGTYGRLKKKEHSGPRARRIREVGSAEKNKVFGAEGRALGESGGGFGCLFPSVCLSVCLSVYLCGESRMWGRLKKIKLSEL